MLWLVPSSELWQDQAGHTHSSEDCEEQLLNTETRVTAVHTWIPEPEDSVAKATAFTICSADLVADRLATVLEENAAQPRRARDWLVGFMGLSCGDVVSDQRHRAGALKIYCRCCGSSTSSTTKSRTSHRNRWISARSRVRSQDTHQELPDAFRNINAELSGRSKLSAPGTSRFASLQMRQEGGDGFGQRASKQPFLASAALPTPQDRDPDCRCRRLGKLTGD